MSCIHELSYSYLYLIAARCYCFVFFFSSAMDKVGGAYQIPSCSSVPPRKNMDCLESTMETIVFDNLICWKCLGTDHKQVLWLLMQHSRVVLWTKMQYIYIYIYIYIHIYMHTQINQYNSI